MVPQAGANVNVFLILKSTLGESLQYNLQNNLAAISLIVSIIGRNAYCHGTYKETEAHWPV